MSRHNHFFILSLLVVSLCICACKENETNPFFANDTEDTLLDNDIPVVEIRTENGLGVTDKKYWRNATIKIRGNSQLPDLDVDSILLKGRGNSTFDYRKKSFNIKFSKKTPVLGMPKGKKWVFLANYRDRTLLRNDVTFYIGSLFKNLGWTPRGEFVDLYFNGHYVGNYYVCEKIASNKNRVPIDEMTEDDIFGENLTGGYILQLDKYYDEENKFRSEHCNLPVEIMEPDANTCRPEQFEYIQQYINTCENCMVNGNFNELYDKYIDINSFADYYLVQALVGNQDFSGPYSAFFHKGRNEKLKAGPLWDFDFSTYKNYNGCLFSGNWWWKYLLADPIFRQVVCERWNEVCPLLEEKVFPYIEKQKNRIFLSAMATESVFAFDYSVNMNKIDDSGFLIAYDQMIDVLHARIQLLNNIYGAYNN